MGELKGAVLLRYASRKGGILLGQHRELDLAGHFEVILHLDILGMQLLLAPGQVGIGPLQLFFCQPFFGNIPENALQSDNFARSVFKRSFDDLHVDLISAGRLVFLDRVIRLHGFHHATVVTLIFLGQFAWEEVEVRFAHYVLELSPQYFAELLIGEGEPFLQVLAENILRQGLHQRMIQGLGIPQILLDLPALGNIFDGPLVIEEPALWVANRAAILRNPNHRSILAVDL